jgi:hypothetical protein
MGSYAWADTVEHCSASDVRRCLSYLLPHLDPYWKLPLTNYASAIYDIDPFASRNAVRIEAMDRLRICVERAARRSGYAEEEARSASAELLAAPLMQTGPHAMLLVEPDAFYTHLFSLLGLMSHGRQWHITYSVSTSAFKESAKKGPGWLRVGGEVLNVFGLPRKRMIGSSIACLDGPYRFTLSNAKHEVAPNAPAARLLAELPAMGFPSGAEAIKMGNQALWHRKFAARAKLLQLDDFDIADLIADHLEDTRSWLSRHFFGGSTAAISILAETDQLNAGPWAGWIRRTTDLFWGLEKNRVVPLYLKDGVLRSMRSTTVTVEFTPECLAAALRARIILPGMFLAYLMLSILPGVRVFGGCRQTVYLPLMRYLASIGIEMSGDTVLLAELESDKLPGVWGHRVLKPANGDPFQEIECEGGVAPLLARYADMTLEQASGDLASFTRDSIWADISAHIANGAITRTSHEWNWSGC